jgi:hypothetical protein
MKALYTPFLYLFVVIRADGITAFAPPMTQCTVKWMVPTPKQQQQQQQLEKNCRKVSYQQVSTQRSLLSFQNVIATVLHHNPDDHHVAMAGTIWPIIHKLLTAPTKFRSIWHNIVSITEWQECILFPLLAFGLMPIAKLYYKTMIRKSHNRPMENMKRFGVIAFIDQISKVALSVFAMDVVSITLTTIGFGFAKEWRIAEVYAKLACTYFFVFVRYLQWFSFFVLFFFGFYTYALVVD